MTHLWISMNARGYLEIHTGTDREAATAERCCLCVPINLKNAETWITVLSDLISKINTALMNADSSDEYLNLKSAASLENFPTTPDTITLFIQKIIGRNYQDGYLMFLRQLLAKWCEIYTMAMREV